MISCKKLSGAGIKLSNGASRPIKLLLRSSWQTVNIGDISHTPGLLNLLEKHIPNVEVQLWPNDIGNGVEEILKQRFPKLAIIENDSELARAFEECDFLLHGSAPMIDVKSIKKWRSETHDKPYGVYGISLTRPKLERDPKKKAFDKSIKILNGAQFVFCRDSISLSIIKKEGCLSPVLDFAPDAAFACDLRNDGKAEKFLADNGLEHDKFLCCIPRLRYTPYWNISEKQIPFDQEKHARNEAMKASDHEPLLKAIEVVIKNTDLKILLCPEDVTQMAVGKDVIFDRLGPSIRDRVVWRSEFWLTDEAISTYANSAGLFGNEMHSAIMCIGHSIPALVCRWHEQTTKGYMWHNIGLDNWLFNFDIEKNRRRFPEEVLKVALDPEAASATAFAANLRVTEQQKNAMRQIAHALSLIEK